MAPPPSRRWIASSARATPMSPKPSARCSAASASTPSPARPRSSSSPTPTNDPRRVAVDLLAQAEHDEAAQAILITDDAGFADAVAAAVAAELATLPRAAIAGASWRGARRDHPGARLGRGGRAGQPAGARAPAIDAARSGAGVRPHPPRRRGVPRRASVPRRSATTWPARTTCCRPDAPRASPPACRCSTSSSAPPGSRPTPAALARVGPAAVALAEAEGLQAHARSIALRLGG